MNISHLPGAMSGGQQQRVCIARALSNKPAILSADEPTGNLDGRTGREVLSLMRTVGKELGITLIILFSYNDNQLSVLRRRRFGFVFQSYNLVRELTAQENILLPVMLDGRKPDEAHISHLIELLGIEDRLSHLPGAMSGGQQQRVCIARALSNKPAILFADEPTGNLDGRTGREVLSLMRTVGKELGITLIIRRLDPRQPQDLFEPCRRDRAGGAAGDGHDALRFWLDQGS